MKDIIIINLLDLLSHLKNDTLEDALQSIQEAEFGRLKNEYIDLQRQGDTGQSHLITTEDVELLNKLTFSNINIDEVLDYVKQSLPKQITELHAKANRIRTESHIQIILKGDEKQDDYKQIASVLAAAPSLINRYRIIFTQKPSKPDTNPINTLMDALYLQIVKLEIPSINIDKPGPLLLCGHTGSGKSLTAQLLAGNNKKSITLNMAALTDTLLESRIRGYAKGAYTGATNTKVSIFEEADNGVLFFDELQSASIEAQTQLLDLINSVSNKVRVARIGEDHNPKEFNVKTIFAVNEDISALIEENRLRKDLFFRMRQVVEFRSLSERLNDGHKGIEFLDLLIAIHRWKYAIELNPQSPQHSQVAFEDTEYEYYQILKAKFSEQAMTALREHNWPGNLREFERVMADIFWDVKQYQRNEIDELTVRAALNVFDLSNTSDINHSNDIKPTTKDNLTDDERYIIQSIEEKLDADNFSVQAILPTLKIFGMSSRKSFKTFMAKYQNYFDTSIIEKLKKTGFKIPTPEDIHTQS